MAAASHLRDDMAEVTCDIGLRVRVAYRTYVRYDDVMSVGLVEQLEAVLDAVAALDPGSLDDAELDELVVGLGRSQQRLAGVTAPLLARWDTVGVWAGDGSRSAASRLARDCGTSPRTARVELRRARHLARMPHTADAVAAGRASMDLVDLLGRADQPSRHDVFVEHEATLVDECARLRHRQAARLVDYWIQRADAAGSEADAARLRGLGHAARVDDARRHGAHRRHARPDRRHDRHDRAATPGTRAVPRRPDRRCHPHRRATPRRRTRRDGHPLRRDPGRIRNGPRPLFTVLVGDDTFAQLCELADRHGRRPRPARPAPRRRRARDVLFADPPPSFDVATTAPSPAPCDARSRSATGTANTPPAATSPPPTATSTTSCRGRQPTHRPVQRPPRMPHPQPPPRPARPPRHTTPRTRRRPLQARPRPPPLARLLHQPPPDDPEPDDDDDARDRDPGI